MSGDLWKGIIEDLRKDSFERGAEDMSDFPIVFIDPKAFDNPLLSDLSEEEIDKNINLLKEQMESQQPGLVDSYVSFINASSDDGEPPKSEREVLLSAIIGSKMVGPAAMSLNHEGQKICIINKPDEQFDSREELISAIIGSREIPSLHIHDDVTDDSAQRYVGAHEGTHCNEDVLGGSNFEVLAGEVNADRAAIDYLRGRGDDVTADTMIYARAISGEVGGKRTHAIAGLLRNDDFVEKVHVEAMHSFEDAVDGRILEDTGMSKEDLSQMKADNMLEYVALSNVVTADMKENGSPLERAQAQYQEVLVDAVVVMYMDGDAPDRAMAGVGEPDVAGDAGLAARAAEQAGADPSLVTAIAPQAPAVGIDPSLQQQPAPSDPSVAPPSLDFAY